VLAAYAAGTCGGLLAYGALGDRVSTRNLFAASLLGTAGVSAACAAATNVETLIALRAVQGALAAGPAVFAPGIVRALFNETAAIRVLGALGSIEALAPALAPIVGAWLLAIAGWQSSFLVIGGLALFLATAATLSGAVPQVSRRKHGQYRRLIADPVFLRYALSQAFVLGGLLTFVFGMPAVFVRALGGDLADFIVMQIFGVGMFMIAANLTGRLVTVYGAERLIMTGTVIATVGAAAILAYALLGGIDPIAITALSLLVSVGLGLRGPPGFFRAVIAAHGDDARGSALVILLILGAAAIGTAVAAPFVEDGLAPLALTSLVLHVLALGCLTLPKLVTEVASA
jgi:MFS family permease